MSKKVWFKTRADGFQALEDASWLALHARRPPEIDRTILAGFVLGLSTRKLGEVLLSLLGRPVSPSAVSRVAQSLDAAVAAFHRRPLSGRYKALMLDGVVLARKTGAGALRRPVLVALGLRQDGKKEVIDFRLARGESAAEWERFLDDLYKRGLAGEGLDMICVDGGSGLLAALPRVYDKIPVQRCWAHKIRNILNKVRKADQTAVKADLHAVMNAEDARKARSAARRFAERWGQAYPAAVTCLRDDLDELLTCFRYKTLAQRRAVRQPTPSNAGSERSAAEPGPWACFRTQPQWTVFSSLSSPMKTKCRESQPFSP